MAKSSIDTGEDAQAVHTRTTGGSEESQVVVLGDDGADAVVSATTTFGLPADAEASGDGSILAILKRLRTLLNGGFPAALSAGGGVKTGVVDALPAGTNNIGDVDVLTLPALPAGTNNIGDVDVLSIIPGTAATNSGKAEDAVHASGDTGVAVLAVRRDTAAVGSGTDGDYSTLNVDANGNVWVRIGVELPAGTQNIGDVDIASMPAAARTTDTISVALATDKLMQNLTERTPTFAVIDFAGAGDNTLVAAAGSGNKIRVHQLFLVCSAGENTIRFESGAGGTALTGQMTISDNQGFVLPFSPVGWFETAANTLLNLELSAATSVDGCLLWSIAT